MKNYYELLGIDKNASKDDINKAFKSLAKIHHPDKGGNEEDFKAINKAHKVLSNDELRKRYDLTGSESEQPQQPNFNHFDFFNQMFGGRGFPFGGSFGQQRQNQPAPPSKAEDVRKQMEITLEQAYFGRKEQINFERDENCKCLKTCGACNGSGNITQHIQLGPGMTMQQTQKCYACQGKCFTPHQECQECKGSGQIKFKKLIEVNIPPRVDEAWTQEFEGCGNPASRPQDKPGNLILGIKILPHGVFEKKGNDLHIRINLSLWESIRGKEFGISHFKGTLMLNTENLGIVPHKYTHKVEGFGFTDTGSLNITFYVDWPKTRKLTDEEKQKLDLVKSAFE